MLDVLKKQERAICLSETSRLVGPIEMVLRNTFSFDSCLFRKAWRKPESVFKNEMYSQQKNAEAIF
jgi:hypothetical protein